MTIRITCPGCATPLTLADTMAGKKVRCTSCKKVLAIPASKKKVLASGDEPDEDEDEKPQVKAKSRDADDDTDSGDVEDRPKKKKKKKKNAKQGYMALIIGGVSVGVVLLLVGGAAALVFALKPDEAKKEAEKKHAQQILAELKNKDVNGNVIMKDNVKDQAMPVQPVQPQGKDGGFRIIPKIQEGNPNTKKGGDNIISSVRGSGYRLERQNELSNIGKSYIQYYDEFKGGSRNMKTWLEYIKTFGPIREAVEEGYYKMNFNATLDGNSVIAYERDIDKGTHLCVRGSGQVEYVRVAELKGILGRDP